MIMNNIIISIIYFIIILLRMNKNEVLSDLYYDIGSGFGSAKSLYDDAIKKGLVITQQEVNDWLKNQSLKQRKNYKNYNSYSTPFARSVFSCDIMDMISLMKDTGTYNEDTKLWFGMY